MKKLMLSTVFLVPSLFLGAQSVLAESVAVKGNAVFILDNSLATGGPQILVKDFNGNPVSCIANAGALNLTSPTIATDIVIKDGTAVVTTQTPLTPPLSATDVKFVDVSSCPIAQTVDLSACYATVSGGKLTIPCLNYNNEVISVVLGERGNSSNYEFESAGPGHNHGNNND